MFADEPPLASRRERLRELRVQLNMTKMEAARIVGVSRRKWHEAEEGPRELPGETSERARMIEEMVALFQEIEDG